MMKIYTKTGDLGKTSLGNGKRVPKYSPYLDVYGTIDELNSFVGLSLCFLSSKDPPFKKFLSQLQHLLFNLGSDLASPDSKNKKIKRISLENITSLEKEIDRLEAKLLPLKNFILPGGTSGSSVLHCCRTICRRAERSCSNLSKKHKTNPHALVFLNRLSDYLFVAARYENFLNNQTEPHWDSSDIPS